MGLYVNPGKLAFTQIAGPNYVDKTGLIGLLNDRINGPDNLVCISRPRRFGKSYAAKMLYAYYDSSCSSEELFAGRSIAKTGKYSEHLNKYNVIGLDIAGFISKARRKGTPLREVPDMIVREIMDDLLEMEPHLRVEKGLEKCLLQLAEGTEGKRFVFIIDEWDAMIREAKDDEEAQTRYLDLLRAWFKDDSFTPKAVALAYLTGILPIKKDGSQSAISDFKEFTILDTDGFAPYTGFLESEVKEICQRSGMNFGELKAWYDGYDFSENEAIYNPYSVMEAARTGKCQSYWGKTSAAEALTTYIDMDFEGLQQIVARLMNGEELEVYTDDFQNDFERFETKDDILTLLIHLGYLTYQSNTQTARIPNEEIRNEFKRLLRRKTSSRHWVKLIRRSEKILTDTLAVNGQAVAAAIEEIRMEQYAPQFNNNEQALRAIIKYAYFAAIPHYIKLEEVPSGKGIADIVFIPKQGERYPALVVELKWNRSTEKARQIESRGYTTVLKDYGGKILLVAISYDEKTNEHVCEIREA